MLCMDAMRMKTRFLDREHRTFTFEQIGSMRPARNLRLSMLAGPAF